MDAIEKLEGFISQYRTLPTKISNQITIKDFFKQWSVIKSCLDESVATIYIDYTCDTANQEKIDLLQKATLLQEQVGSISHKITEKLISFYKDIPPHLEYAFKLLHNSLFLFNEDNLPLETKEQILSQEYQSLIGNLTFQYEGKEFPIAESKRFLEDPNREIRKEVFTKTQTSFFNIHKPINDIFHKQAELRNQQALNSKYPNYRNYMHQAKDRFDYSTNDCEEFSQSILKHIVPLSTLLRKKRQKNLHLPFLEPYDLNVDLEGKAALKPFTKEEEFIPKTLEILNAVNPHVAKTLKQINDLQKLDLFSRQNKAPGGYNFPLSQSKTSFIFMNCTFTHTDLITLIHEVGHAYHFDCYKNNQDPFIYHSPPSEVAELASMSMELMSMEHWNLIYHDKDLKKAKNTQLEGIIHFFPWMAVVDSFQQWVYTHPKSSQAEHNEYFKTLYNQFFPAVSWDNFTQYLPTMWQKQPHIVEVPFYYIEYGIAQLGALQIWDQYKKDPSKTFENYTNALSLGSSKPIKEIYQQAYIDLNFSETFIQTISKNLMKELDL